MTKPVTPDTLADAITSALAEYADGVSDGMKKAVDMVTVEAAEEIKRHITFTSRTKKYIRAFSTRTAFEDRLNKRNTWYVKAPEYRKTHLLENGHLNRDGTRTRAFPHIKYGAELAEKRLPELVEKVAQGEEVT